VSSRAASFTIGQVDTKAIVGAWGSRWVDCASDLQIYMWRHESSSVMLLMIHGYLSVYPSLSCMVSPTPQSNLLT
jgi:hypothetical protein